MKTSAKAWRRIGDELTERQRFSEASIAYGRAATRANKEAEKWWRIYAVFFAISFLCQVASLILRLAK